MVERGTRATLSKGREGYCVMLRHPVARTPDGKSKLRIRRGLGTRDEHEAQRLVDDLNEIVADPAMHVAAARSRAAVKYDSRIVAAFYDCLDPIAHDAWSERERVIGLPGPEQGYARVMLIGTTGSGKTTLLRQIIGTDPVKERFPSTSAAKTTTADIEVVIEDGTYAAVVSFLPQEHVRMYVSECITAAVTAQNEGTHREEVSRRLLEHADQRFRLSYVLGSPPTLHGDYEDEKFDDDDDDELELSETPDVDAQQRERFSLEIQGYLNRVAELAKQLDLSTEETATELGIDLNGTVVQDRDVVRELALSELSQSDAFDSLVDDIVDAIEERFDLVGNGEYVRGKSGWPILWKSESADRATLIKAVNRFSSNYAPNFGTLLTPIVDGIRVRGPFRATWLTGAAPRLVLMDGQGIGHTADASSSISTTVTRRFKTTDAIVLVDNAAQPMQAGSVAILRALVTSGHESKLCVCFTHFDDVRGPNLPSIREKRDHVISSFTNAAHALGQQIHREAEQALLRMVPERFVFLARIDETLAVNTRAANELQRLESMIERLLVTPPAVELQPVYDVANLVLAIERAARAFHQRWRNALASEHWTRLKALTRRVGVLNQDEYDNLRPVADLINHLQSMIHSFLARPLAWEPPSRDEDLLEEKSHVTGAIRQSVSEKLHELSQQRMIESHLKDWSTAYYLSGRGSGIERARGIKRIYDAAAPIPAEMPNDEASDFLFAIRALVAEAIKSHKGKVKGWEP